jgi:hypothetical protein
VVLIGILVFFFCLSLKELPSERDSPETLRAKMGTASGGSRGIANVPLPKTGNKYGKVDEYESNPFGYSQEDQDHYWYVNKSMAARSVLVIMSNVMIC